MSKKQKQVSEIISEEAFPNIKDVPTNCKKILKENDKVYAVPGNGACFANSAAAHLFQDEFLGPQLRLRMNNFLAEHFEKYEEIIPCSENLPFIRQLRGKEVIFTDPIKLKRFLKTSVVSLQCQ